MNEAHSIIDYYNCAQCDTLWGPGDASREDPAHGGQCCHLGCIPCRNRIIGTWNGEPVPMCAASGAIL